MALLQSVRCSEDPIVGYVGLSKTWQFIRNPVPFVLPRSVCVVELKKDSYLGMSPSIGIYKKLLEVNLGNFSHYRLFQVCATTSLDNISIPLLKVQFIGAVDDALKCLKHADLKSDCCSSYADALECYNCQDTFSIEIGVKLVKKFGEILNAKFHKRLAEIHPDCRTFTVLKDFQKAWTAPIDEVIEKNFFVEHFTELSVHFRREFTTPNDAVFWKRESVINYMGSTPDREYYPALANGHGDFVFNRMKREENPNGIHITNVRFYNEIFMQKRPELFTRPFFADFLAGNMDKRFKRETLPELEWLPLLSENLCEHITNKESITATLRAILSVEKPDGEAVQHMRLEFDRVLGKPAKELVRSFTMDIIREELLENLMPAVLTLKELISKKVASLNSNTIHVTSLNDLKLASVCEAILCFAVNGTAFSYGGTPMHSIQLISDFELMPYNFRGQLYLFVDLHYLPNIVKVEDKINIENYSKVPLYIDNVFFNVNYERQQVIEQSLRAIKNGHDVYEHSEAIARIFWRALKQYVVDTFFDKHNRVLSLEEIADTIVECANVRPMSTKEFMEWLGGEDAPSVLLSSRFLALVKKELSPEQFAGILEACAAYIEDKLYELVTMLVFPIKSTSDVAVILPIRVTEHGSFVRMHSFYGRSLFGHYESVFTKLYQLDFECIHISLIEYQTKHSSEFPVKMSQVFEWLREQRPQETDIV